MTPFKELMILHSSPVVGDTKLRSRTETYVTGEGGVMAIERDGDTVTIRGEKRTIVLPWGVCRWAEVAASQALVGAEAIADKHESAWVDSGRHAAKRGKK